MGLDAIFDVREVHEYAGGHIAGAFNLPLSELQAGQIAIPEGRRCLIYCESGARCPAAAERLQAAGYRDIFTLRGGRKSWQDAHKALEES